MFGESKVLQDGAEAQAVILEARPGNVLNRHGERNWHFQLRVHFGDGQTADVEAECYDLSLHATGPVSGLEPYPFATGGTLPVRYDANNRSKVEIDRPKIVADTVSAYQADSAKKIARAEQQFAPSTAPSQASQEKDENYLMDALAAAQTRGDAAEVARLTALVEKLIADA